MNESRLAGDVRGEVPFLNKEIVIECKTGYGGSKQHVVKKEWLDKVREEAEGAYAIPMLACKFSNARAGVKHFVCLDFDAFVEILEEANKLYQEVIKFEDEKELEKVLELKKTMLEE